MANHHSIIDLTLIFLIYGIEGQQLADVRLVNGRMPNEGIVIYTVDCETWETTCGLNLGKSDAIVFCRHLGFAGSNRALPNPPFESPFDNPPTTHTSCGAGDIGSCIVLSGCSDATPGGTVCYGSNYLSCFVDEPNDRVLDDEANTNFTGLTINKCLDFCRQNSDMKFAGVENTNECFCGDGASNYSRHGRVSDSECQFQCDGSQTENCGGHSRIGIFDLTIEPDYSPSPMYSCDMTTPQTSTASLKTVQSTSLPESAPSSTNVSAISAEDTTTPQPTTYHATTMAGRSTELPVGEPHQSDCEEVSVAFGILFVLSVIYSISISVMLYLTRKSLIKLKESLKSKEQESQYQTIEPVTNEQPGLHQNTMSTEIKDSSATNHVYESRIVVDKGREETYELNDF